MNNNRDEDRRKTQRFQVSWEVAVRGTDRTGTGFVETGTLENLSSAGASLYLSGAVPVGARLEVRIRVPLKKNNWMKYEADVVRVKGLGDVGIAVKFDTARPVFMEG